MNAASATSASLSTGNKHLYRCTLLSAFGLANQRTRRQVEEGSEGDSLARLEEARTAQLISIWGCRRAGAVAVQQLLPGRVASICLNLTS